MRRNLNKTMRKPKWPPLKQPNRRLNQSMHFNWFVNLFQLHKSITSQHFHRVFSHFQGWHWWSTHFTGRNERDIWFFQIAQGWSHAIATGLMNDVFSWLYFISSLRQHFHFCFDLIPLDIFFYRIPNQDLTDSNDIYAIREHRPLIVRIELECFFNVCQWKLVCRLG